MGNFWKEGKDVDVGGISVLFVFCVRTKKLGRCFEVLDCDILENPDCNLLSSFPESFTVSLNETEIAVKCQDEDDV